MPWENCKVVAAPNCFDTGIRIHNPILKDFDSNWFSIGNADCENPEASGHFAHEIYQHVHEGILIEVPERPALRHFKTIVVSPSFVRAMVILDNPGRLEWVDIRGGKRFAYITSREVPEWRDACAQAFLKWARRQLADFNQLREDKFRGVERPRSLLSDTEAILKQTRWVTDKGYPNRKEFYLLFGLFLDELSILTNNQQKRIQEQVSEEFGSGFDFGQQIKVLKEEIYPVKSSG